jgi:hypothetical protein
VRLASVPGLVYSRWWLFVVAVFAGVDLAGFFSVVRGMVVMAVGNVSMMPGFFVVPFGMGVGGRAMMLGGVFVMVSGFGVVVGSFFGHVVSFKNR